MCAKAAGGCTAEAHSLQPRADAEGRCRECHNLGCGRHYVCTLHSTMCSKTPHCKCRPGGEGGTNSSECHMSGHDSSATDGFNGGSGVCPHCRRASSDAQKARRLQQAQKKAAPLTHAQANFRKGIGLAPARPPQPLPVRAPTKALLDYPNEMLHFGTYYVRKWRGPSGPTPSGAVLKHPNPAAQESAAEAQRQSRKEWLHRFTCLQNHQHISGVYNPLYALSFDAPTKSDSNPGSRAQKLYDLLVAALPPLWKGGFCGRRTSATRQHYDIDWAAWRAAQPAS